MQFKSGMLGACIVVLALFGTILSGFFLGVEPATREVTKYDYITDVTGLFDVTQSPEYVEYSPSSNYVGYTPPLTVDYSPSSTVNSYRYIVANGTTATSSYTARNTSSYPSDTGRFSPAEAGSQAMINWNGSIDFGNTITWQGVTYNTVSAGVNVTIGDVVGSMPMITSLARVISAFNLNSYNTLSIDVSYGAYPVLIYYGDWAFTDVDRADDSTQYIYSATMNESNAMPDHLEVNMAGMTVTASRNGTQMWNVNASQVDVIYNYSTRASGSFSPATSSATFAITAKTFPTYGYMDPTRGVSMDSYGEVSSQTISSSQSYTAMSDLFTTPNIPYPDTPDTSTRTWGSSSFPASSYNMADFSFWNGDTRAIGLSIYFQYAGQPFGAVTVTNPATYKANPDVASLGDWVGLVLTQDYGTTLADYSTIDIALTTTGDYPVFLIPKSDITTDYETLNNIMYKYDTSWTNTPDKVTIDCSTGLAVAYRTDSQLWTADISDIIVVNRATQSSGSATIGTRFDFTINGIPGTNTGPSYPILYIDNTDDYGGSWTDHLTIAGTPVNTAVFMNTATNTLQLTSLQTIFSTWGLSASKTYNISLDHGDYPIYMHPKSSAMVSFLEVGDYTQPWARYYYQAGDSTPYTVIDRMTYDNGTVTAYVDDTPVWTATPNDVWVAYKYSLLDGSSAVPSVYQEDIAPVSVNVSIREITEQIATWANGYQNDEITITVQRYDLNGNDLTIRAGSSYVTIAINTAGNITVTDGTQTLNMGAWRGIQLNIRATQGYLSVTPSNNLSFTNPISTGATTRTIDNWYSGGTISTMYFSTANQSPYWQITRTTVFLDTFNAVMNDPSIDIKQYFPELEDWRLNFYSFATYGDSMTINGIVFTVDRSRGTVTWEQTFEDDVTRQYTETLNNIYITDQDVNGAEHLVLTFVNNGAVYDLGERITNTVSFSGLWFFTTGLYNAVTALESYYDWQLDSAFHIDGNQALLIFLGLLVIGALLTKGLFHISFKSLDYVILIGAGLFIGLFLGGI